MNFFYKESKSTKKGFLFGGLRGGGEGARVSDFFTKDPNIIFGEDLRGGGGVGAEVSDFFSSKDPNLIFWGKFRGGGGVRGWSK